MSNDNSLIRRDKKTGENLYIFLRQFILTAVMHRKAVVFIRQNKPWIGLYKYGWTAWIMVIAAVVLGWQFFREFYGVINSLAPEKKNFTAGMSAIWSSFSLEKFGWVMQGSRKYLVLIVLEILTFHIVRRTLELRTGRISNTSFQSFLHAEVRMMKVSGLAWLMETIMRAVVGAALGIIGLQALKSSFGFVIQCYFLGFTIMDNYNECFGLKIRESERRTRQLAGISLAVGMTAYLLMFVPVAGVVTATALGAVAATLAMEKFAPLAVADAPVNHS